MDVEILKPPVLKSFLKRRQVPLFNLLSSNIIVQRNLYTSGTRSFD